MTPHRLSDIAFSMFFILVVTIFALGTVKFFEVISNLIRMGI